MCSSFESACTFSREVGSSRIGILELPFFMRCAMRSNSRTGARAMVPLRITVGFGVPSVRPRFQVLTKESCPSKRRLVWASARRLGGRALCLNPALRRSPQRSSEKGIQGFFVRYARLDLTLSSGGAGE